MRSQEYMKLHADAKRRDVNFKKGDMVYLKLQPYRQKSLAVRPNEKLSPRFYGPFEIEDKVGLVAYKLSLPPTARIHPVFHVSQLKRSVSPYVSVHPFPPMLSEDLEMQVQPEAALKARKMTDGSIEVLIKWQNLPATDNTWESLDVMKEQFPTFDLEDKVLFEEEGNDGKGPFITYVRRKKSDVGIK